MGADRPTLEILNEDQCQLLLSLHDIGRISFVVDGIPEILPVSYVSEGSTVVFRTGDGVLAQKSIKQRVAFEVDAWDATVGEGWSVVVKGIAEEITSSIDPYARALHERRVIPLAPGIRERWIAVYASRVSGRRFRW